MSLRDSKERYGVVSKTFHWLVAFLVMIQLSGEFFGWWWPGNVLSRVIQPWHSTIGMVLLLVMVLRVYWFMLQSGNRPRSEGVMVKIGHAALYSLLLTVPLSGFLMVWSKGYGVNVFGERVLDRGGDVFLWASVIENIHVPMAWIMAMLIVGHIGMAIYHHAFGRDNSLRRMV